MYPLSNYRTLALVSALALIAYPITTSAAIGDVEGDRIIGQPTATTVNSATLLQPFATAFDASGNLFVADTFNHRVLGYRSPMTTDLVADIVVGQPDFNSNTANNGGVSAASLYLPFGLAVSPTGDLYVADTYNNRVLQYDRPFVTDVVADRFFGQPDFASNIPNANNPGNLPNAGTLFAPAGVAVDTSGNLWVADFANNRVLEYDNPIATSDRLADRVLGQPSFTDSTLNMGGLSAKSLAAPFSVATDSQNNVWVADYVNSRVLEYDDPVATDATADRFLGQPSFTSNVVNYTGQISAAGLYNPYRVNVDRNGNVYVCDTFNHRVLLYTAPIATSDRIADRVFGQPDLNSGAENNGGISKKTLSTPSGVAIDAVGNVAIADQVNNRVVLLQTPTPIVTSVEVKVSPATRKAKLFVRGYGMVSGEARVEVDGTPLGVTKYKELAADGSARRLVGIDAAFDTVVPEGLPVIVTVYNPATGSRSAPIPFTR
jgi:sugar lactone lactonase YvrE